MAYVVNANDTSTPTNDQGATQGAEELRALKTKVASVVAGALIATAAGATPADLTTFIQPDVNDRPAMVAGGWLPWNLNQQWGGAPMPFHLIDSATGAEFKFDAFDAYIEINGATAVEFNFGDAAGTYFRAQSIVAPKNQSLQAIWVKIYKVANPVDNVTLKLWSVAAGVPNATIATANVINGKQITSDVSGQWYRFSFAAVQALVAGTQYMITLEKSGGVDAVNFYRWKGAQPNKNPNNLFSNGTAVPAWTPANTASGNIIAEAQASDQVVQSVGTFNGRIVGFEGNPINHSVGFIKPLREFFPLFNPNGWSVLLRGKNWTKDKTIAEIMYGLHHDRINVRSAVATGFTTVTLYKQDGTVVTLVGTSDISSASYKDILIVGRTLGDGGDYLKIYTGINNVWTKEIESTALTLTLDPLMLVQGHMWIMGGFPLFSNATYTKLSDMTILPSADGWTFTGAAVEGSVFAVSGGKLNQIKAGYAAGNDGYYKKAALALSNANGWLATTKLRVINGTNTNSEISVTLDIYDGTKRYLLAIQEYFTQLYNGAWQAHGPQLDFKTNDSTIIAAGKGSDALTFVNGRLVHDGIGFMTSASGLNEVHFGDQSLTANENSDVIWDYVGYYNTSNIYPQFTSGELHEFAVWSGDKNLLGATLYNLGVSFSVKQYCGVGRNFAGREASQRYRQRLITADPTSTSATLVTLSEMEVFALGTLASINLNFAPFPSANAVITSALTIDGVLTGPTMQSDALTGNRSTLNVSDLSTMPFGLHKIEGRSSISGGLTSTWRHRSLSVEVKV